MTDEKTLLVTAHYELDLDPDRVAEWVEANYSEDDQVQVTDPETGDQLYDSL